MNKVYLVIFGLTMFVACQPQQNAALSTSSEIKTVNNVVQYSSLVSTLGKNSAKFECLQNIHGACHYVVFSSACQNPTTNPQMMDQICLSGIVEQFSLPSGTSKTLLDLPENFKFASSMD